VEALSTFVFASHDAAAVEEAHRPPASAELKDAKKDILATMESTLNMMTICDMAYLTEPKVRKMEELSVQLRALLAKDLELPEKDLELPGFLFLPFNSGSPGEI
jgi:hypothetical protein